MKRVFKQIVLLNLCLTLVTVAGSAWTARTVGSSAYLAGAVAMLVVGLAASLALVITFRQSASIQSAQSASRQSVSASGSDKSNNNSVTAVLLAMLVRMGLPIAFAVFMAQAGSPLMDAGLFGLVTLNYLVALPLETAMSLQFLRPPKASVVV